MTQSHILGERGKERERWLSRLHVVDDAEILERSLDQRFGLMLASFKLSPSNRSSSIALRRLVSIDPSPILPIPPADSPVSLLTPPPAVDPILDQTLNLPPAAPIAPPPVVDLVLDQPPDLPLVALPTDFPISPQEPAPPVNFITDQTPPLPLRQSDNV
ncbi:hypothetical protein FCV25MIE_28770 [Fagus crenata]